MIGLHLRYQRSELATLLMALSEYLNSIGQPTSVISAGQVGTDVYPTEARIRSDTSIDYPKWAKSCSHIIFTTDVPIQYMQEARKAGSKVILIIGWTDHDIINRLHKVASKLVVLSPSLTRKLRDELRLRNVIYAPADLPLIQPRTSSILTPDRPRILLHLRGSRNSQLGSQLQKTLTNWFHQIPAEWTIWVPKSLTSPKAWIHKTLQNNHPDSSFHFATRYDYDMQRYLYGWNDLTIYPTLNCGFAMHIVLSLLMGAPVVTFDVPPNNEYSTASNSVLISCRVDYCPHGTAVLRPDLPRLEAAVTKIMNQKNTLGKLKKHTEDWTQERRNLYSASWQDALDL